MSGAADRSGPRLRRPEVLVVDDDPLIRSLLARLLVPIGCEVAAAASAAEARALSARKPRYLVAVIDLGLPDGYGVDLIEELAEDLGDRAPPFIILSGERPARLPAGVLAVLEKPHGLARVAPLVRGALAAALAASPLPEPTLARAHGGAPRRARALVAEEHVTPDRRDPRRER